MIRLAPLVVEQAMPATQQKPSARQVPATRAQPAAQPKSSPLASRSVREHYIRGVIGLLAAVLAIVLTSVIGPVAIALLAVTAVAWRGCPTCWAVGLMGTRAGEDARRNCSSC